MLRTTTQKSSRASWRERPLEMGKGGFPRQTLPIENNLKINQPSGLKLLSTTPRGGFGGVGKARVRRATNAAPTPLDQKRARTIPRAWNTKDRRECRHQTLLKERVWRVQCVSGALVSPFCFRWKKRKLVLFFSRKASIISLSRNFVVVAEASNRAASNRACVIRRHHRPHCQDRYP